MRYTFLTLLLFFSTLSHGQTSTTDNLLPSDSLQTDSIIPQPTFQTEADADSTADIDELYGTANKDYAKKLSEKVDMEKSQTFLFDDPWKYNDDHYNTTGCQ